MTASVPESLTLLVHIASFLSRKHECNERESIFRRIKKSFHKKKSCNSFQRITFYTKPWIVKAAAQKKDFDCKYLFFSAIESVRSNNDRLQIGGGKEPTPR